MSGQVRASAARHSGTHDDKQAHAENHLFDKTRLCKFFARGKCMQGPACTFANGNEELETRPDFFRTQLCPSLFQAGACPLGSACSYAHSPQELRRPSVKKGHQAGAALRGAQQKALCEEAEQLDLMQQKIIRLRAQLQELQVLTAERGAPGGSVAVSRVSSSSRDDDASEGLGCPVGSFSRQTTAEGDDDSLAPVPFSRQTSSDEDCDAWEDVVASTEAAEPCEFVVRHTFWSLEPLRTEGQHRRSKSAPAALRTRVGQVA